MVGELGSLRDRLGVVRKPAKQLFVKQQEESYHSERTRLVPISGNIHHPGGEKINDEPDYVFHDEPNHREGHQQEVTIPIHRGKDETDLTWMNYSNIINPSAGGFEGEHEEDHTHNTQGRIGAATDSGAITRNTTSASVSRP